MFTSLRFPRWTPLVLVATLVPTSCRTAGFYAQAARGQWEISRQAKPIGEVLRDAATPVGVRKKLELVQELREFAARELMLPTQRQYDRYRDLGRDAAVWVVFAAPEFSVEARTWWYPLVGSLKYRGFFDEADAQREAARLGGRGNDVFVGAVEAYSTLGWFRDPVLNTFLKRSDANLAELLFHELTHQRLYLSGDTDFNEAFATAVGQEGARRWLRSKRRSAELREFEAEHRLEREFISVVLLARDRLQTMYSMNERESLERLRELKTAAFAQLRKDAKALEARWGGGASLDPWFKQPVNNARLNTLATYYELLPAFERMLEAEGGDLERLYRRVERMRSMSRKERRDFMMSRSGPSRTSVSSPSPH